MVMGMLAVRNLFGETHDLWAVEAQDEYLEELNEGSDASPTRGVRPLGSTRRLFPTRVGTQESA
jgi:hypothetical protein